MQDWLSRSLKVQQDQLWLLDQQALPQQQRWLRVQTVEQLLQYIQALQVRGAPLIGLSACVLVALLAQRGLAAQQLSSIIQRLRQSRPTAVNLSNNLACMEQALQQHNRVEMLVKTAEQLLAQDKQACQQIALAGASLITANSRLLTHCNTGGLATVGIGTALGVIMHGFHQGRVQQVWVDETRPLLQGARLTSWELAEQGIPYQLICDAMAGSLMAQGKVDAVWLGADRIASNGDVANKVGSYSLAVLAHYHRIPCYVAAPRTTLDLACANGQAIPIEQRSRQEVLGAQGAFGCVQWAPAQAAVYNPAFDIIPAELISGWVFETGVVTANTLATAGFASG